MIGVITTADVLAHPLVIFREFGPCVLMRALTARPRETFLSVVMRCAEEEAHGPERELDAEQTVAQFICFETRARDLYRAIGERLLSAYPDAAAFFSTLSRQEEGHALVLASVWRALRTGRLMNEPAIHASTVAAVEALFSSCEAAVAEGVDLEPALAMVETLERSELDLVFHTLTAGLDRRSRADLERFFAVSEGHAAFWKRRVALLREQYGRRSLSSPG